MVYERVKRNPTVEIFAFNDKGEILLNNEYKMQLNLFVWRPPTGRVKENENPIDAAKRELMEEAGYEPSQLVLYKETLPMTSFVHTHYIYLAKGLKPKKIFLVGASYGGMVASQSPIVADLFGMRSHGIILGVIVSIITFGAAVGPVMAGAIYDASASYTVAFIVCFIFAFIGIILSLFLKPVSNGGE